MLCATNATAADELARSVYNVAQTPQNQQITGRVLDAAGEPLIGVSIVEKGNKSNGTVTDVDGNFTLRVSKPTVVVSYVGYKTQEMSVAGKKTLDITLHEDAEMLSDVVVIGYGTVKKADLAGSVAIMDNKSFKDQPVARVEDALNGRMSGVQVMSSGVPGGSMKIRVRGASSVNKSNDPLYVVDGIVRETGLEGINPEDIQSIQVLKDASSTAIYGARGANGVVMVQTKMGKAGTTQVTFDASLGVSNAYNVPEAMNAQDYAKALVQYKGADLTLSLVISTALTRASTGWTSCSTPVLHRTTRWLSLRVQPAHRHISLPTIWTRKVLFATLSRSATLLSSTSTTSSSLGWSSQPTLTSLVQRTAVRQASLRTSRTRSG